MILITKLYYLGSRQNAFQQLILFLYQFPGCSDVKCAHVAELVPWEVGSERGRRFTNQCLQGAHLWRGRQWEPARETLGCDTDKTAPLGGALELERLVGWCQTENTSTKRRGRALIPSNNQLPAVGCLGKRCVPGEAAPHW